jgi:pyrroline-5-carboxylate reductase
VRVLVIGGGELGIRTIKQLQKNDTIEILLADPNERPRAVTEGVVEKVDLVTHVTAMNAREVCARLEPDMVLLARKPRDWGHHDTIMGTQYISGMERELSKLRIPCIPVSSIVKF